MNVFSSEMHLITFLIIIVQIIILVNYIVNDLKERNNKSTKRFLVFTIFFILYNLFSGLFPDQKIPIAISLQLILAYGVGIFVALYYVHYVYTEFNIKQFKYFTVKHLVMVIGSSFIVFFVIPLIILEDLVLSRRLFIFIPILLAFVFLYKVSRPLLKLYKRKKGVIEKFYRDRIITGYIALLSIVLMPVAVSLGDYQVVEQLVVNFGYFVLAAALARNNIYLANKKEQFLKRIGYVHDRDNISVIETFNDFNFSQREIEIANYILDGLSYKKIADNLFIAEGTVSKHASNIFKKAEVEDKKSFVSLFISESV